MGGTFLGLILVTILCLEYERVGCVFVETTHGWIQGKITQNAIVFLGVPYAHPPARYVTGYQDKLHAGYSDTKNRVGH